MEDTSNESTSDRGVGPLLRASRMRIGEDLRDISQTLRIRYPYLMAIEEDRFDALPGQPYAVGFVRAYADHLGLDSEEVVRRFKDEFSIGGQRKTELSFPTPLTEATMPGGAIVFMGLLISVLVYGFWYVSTSDENYLVNLVDPLPESLASLINSEGKKDPDESIGAQKKAATRDESKSSENQGLSNSLSPKINEGSEQKINEGSEQSLSPINIYRENSRPEIVMSESAKPDPPEAAVASVINTKPLQKVESVGDTAEGVGNENILTRSSSTAAPTKEDPQIVNPRNADAELVPEKNRGQVEGTGSSSATSDSTTKTEKLPRILVRARVSSWIQVQDDFSNKILLTRLLKAGEEYAVPDKPGLRLMTGNAGALEILVDGNAVPPIGEEGAVRQGVQLDPSLLRSGTAVSE